MSIVSLKSIVGPLPEVGWAIAKHPQATSPLVPFPSRWFGLPE